MDNKNHSYDELVSRLEELEKKVESLRIAIENKPGVQNNTYAHSNSPQYTPSQQRYIPKQPLKKKEKLAEETIGKYVIPILAVILILASAITLVGLVWSALTNPVRMLILVGCGAIITIVGVALTKKFNKVLMSILVGIGAGLIYIGIISGQLAFYMYDNITTLTLLLIYFVTFMLSYKAVKNFFLIVIAYVGLIVSILFGLTLATGSVEVLMLIIYTSLAVITKLICSKVWVDQKHSSKLDIMSITAYIPLLIAIGTSFANRENIENILVVIACIYGIIFYIIAKQKKESLGSFYAFCISGTMWLSTVCCYGFSIFADIKMLLLIPVLLNAAITLYSDIRIIRKKLFTSNIVLLLISLWLFDSVVFDSIVGISSAGILVLGMGMLSKLRGEILNKNKYVYTSIIIIVLSTIFEIFNNTDSIHNYIFYAINLVVAILFMYIEIKANTPSTHHKFVKVTSALILIANIFNVLKSLAQTYNNLSVQLEIMSAVLIAIILNTLGLSGYFSNWFHDKFKWFGKEIVYDKTEYAWIMCSTLLYFACIGMLYTKLNTVQTLIVILTTTVTAFIQSYLLIKKTRHKKVENLAGVWVGIKYLLLSYAIVNSSLHVPFNSMLVSIMCMIIALVCITVGFKIRIKSIRLYGLMLTIIATLKFITVDMSNSGNVVKVLMILLGGVLCLVIGIIYNIINKKVINT